MTPTESPQRVVIAKIEPLLLRRRAAWRASALAGIAADARAPEPAAFFLYFAANLIEAGRASVADMRERSPYATKEPWRASWSQLVSAGLATAEPDGWRLTAPGAALLGRMQDSSRMHVAAVPFPATELARARRALDGIVAGAGDDTPRMRWARRITPPTDEHGARLEHAIALLLAHRIDAHVSAWRALGYAGPELDALTQAWRGLSTRAEIMKALGGQEPEDVGRNIAALVERGDLTGEGEIVRITPQGRERRDRIELETDRVGLAPWPRGADLDRLGSDLDALAAVLPVANVAH